MTNSGTLRLESEQPGFVIVGTLSNQGAILAKMPDPFLFEGSGVLTGNQEIAVN